MLLSQVTYHHLFPRAAPYLWELGDRSDAALPLADAITEGLGEGRLESVHSDLDVTAAELLDDLQTATYNEEVRTSRRMNLSDS